MSRGICELDFVRWTAKPEVTARLRDRRLIDPVFVESADTHGIEAPIITVADFAGRKVLNYRFGMLTFATQAGGAFGGGSLGQC